MIRVLHVIGAMDRGGAETMIMNFYRNIDLTKYSFDFLVHETRECDYDQEIKKLGGKIYSLPRYKIYNYIEYKHKVAEFFEAHHDYDVVHGHICSCVNIYLREAKKYGIKTIAHSHSSNFGFSLETIFKNTISIRTRSIADYFFGCSVQAGLDRYGHSIVDSDKFCVLNNGIDVLKYAYNDKIRRSLREELNINDKLVLGHVGRFTKAKNHEFIIKLFNEIHKLNKDTVLLLFGRGELEEQVKNLVSSLRLDDSVKFMGVVSDVYNYLNVMDIFLFPSKFEGLGIAAVEAQASGLPCIINKELPKELDVTPCIKRLSLSQPLEDWIDLILNLDLNYDRLYFNEKVHKSSFEIKNEVKKLESIYTKLCYKESL